MPVKVGWVLGVGGWYWHRMASPTEGRGRWAGGKVGKLQTITRIGI
jgi:hypothetical protein